MKLFIVLSCALTTFATQACRSTQKTSSDVSAQHPLVTSGGFLNLTDGPDIKTATDLTEADLQTLLPHLNFATPTLIFANYPCLKQMSAKHVSIKGDTVESYHQEDLTTCIKDLKGPESAQLVSVIARIYRRMKCIDEALERYDSLSFAQVDPTLCLTANSIQLSTQVEWDIHYKTPNKTARSTLRAAAFASDQTPYCTIAKTSKSWTYKPCRYVAYVIDSDAKAGHASLFPPYAIDMRCEERQVANVGDHFTFDSGSCKGYINQWQSKLTLAKDSDVVWTSSDQSANVKTTAIDPRRIKEVSTIGHVFSVLR